MRWRWKFAGLLPEVAKCELWKDEGFGSVFHFAKVLCGMSEKQVSQVFRLDKRLNGMPALYGLFLEGKVSPNKLDRILSIANVWNDEELAHIVSNMSKGALQTLVRDYKTEMEVEEVNSVRIEKGGEPCVQQNNHTTLFDFDPVLPGQRIAYGNMPSEEEVSQEFGFSKGLHLSEEVRERLLELHRKGLDVSRVLSEMLDAREAAAAVKVAK